MTEPTWSLHPQLAADTVAVGDLALSRLLLTKDANYPWLILVPRKPGLVEIIDLEENEQVQLMAEIAACARAQEPQRMRQAQHRGARQ
jgi:diadenosine tetraphosphate (Ap4A) HIT family hydrolase